ncbi:MAG: hypothetical protein B7Z15_05740 [Rhizobiales bacterium 32-66-8]|nr:MAG: hypothetical protein B7Z15_05740 [Rhizobiales bacterium 32-66-8]
MAIPSLAQSLVVLGLVPAALAIVIATDLVGRVIPNLVLILLVAGFACGALALGFALFAQDVIGAGDAKLAAVIALWLDPGQLPVFALICGLLGGLLVAAVTLRARWQRAAPPRSARLAAHMLDLAPSLPYGVALAGAALCLLPASTLVATLT